MINHDMVREATRLTRAGQLVEATALLQRMLRGESTPGSTFHVAPARKANVVDEREYGKRRSLPLLLLDPTGPRVSAA